MLILYRGWRFKSRNLKSSNMPTDADFKWEHFSRYVVQEAIMNSLQFSAILNSLI